MVEPKRKLAAIVFTDIVGFTKLSGENEPAALKLLKTQRELLRPIVDDYGGEWLKEIGDGLVLSFETIRGAVDCSIAIQGAVKTIPGLLLRIGIHQGEVVFQDGDVVGDDVNVASRIEPFAAPGGIAISGRVNTSLERDPNFETTYLGRPNLKGVSQKIDAYCIVSHHLPKTDLSTIDAKLETEQIPFIKKGVLLGFVAAVAIGIGSYLMKSTEGKSPDNFYNTQHSSETVQHSSEPVQDSFKEVPQQIDTSITKAIESAVPIYRFYHKKNKDHFYTKNSDPKGKWKKQGIEFYAYPSP